MTTLSREEIINLVSLNKETVLHTLGLEIESYDPDEFVVALNVDKRHLQSAGILHGGVSVIMAESAASMAAFLFMSDLAYNVFGMEINANHVRTVSSGRIRATAKPVHRGKTTHVYGIEIRNEQGQLTCISRCTVAVRKVV